MAAWHFEKLIGRRGFGEVIQVRHRSTNRIAAVKLERISQKQRLHNEYKCYKLLGSREGIPRVYNLGVHASTHNALFMELLDKSLEDLFKKCERTFTLKTVLMIAIQLLHRIEYIHSRKIIHRDMEPDNFLIGLRSTKREQVIHIIDFGQSKLFLDEETNEHIQYTERRKVVGTALYASINAHNGNELSRRDDLEALGYVFIYFLRGSLPWQNVEAVTNVELWKKIGDAKVTTPLSELCKGCPDEFATYLSYVRQLNFYQEPDYNHFQRLFKDALNLRHCVDDGIFDWS